MQPFCSAITQRELNELYTGYEFDLSGLYGEVLMNVSGVTG